MSVWVVNTHHNLPYDQYIGRGTKWGNKYSHLKSKYTVILCNTREESVYSYFRDLLASPLLYQIPELEGLTLGCFCAPHLCHGNVLSPLANDSVLYSRAIQLSESTYEVQETEYQTLFNALINWCSSEN